MSSLRWIKVKELISRQNQDGTVILMKMDENSLFYKIDGVSARVWSEFESPRSSEFLVQHLSSIAPSRGAEFEKEIPIFIQRLKDLKLLEETALNEPHEFQVHEFDLALPIGSIREFNLEQIETEVLYDNVYLDVFAGSDLRLKQNIDPLPNALDHVRQLDGVQYDWNPALVPPQFILSGVRQTGVIAQQVAEHMPYLVRKDAETGFLAVDYSKLTPYLIEAIKELSNQVQMLQARLDTLIPGAANSVTPAVEE